MNHSTYAKSYEAHVLPKARYARDIKYYITKSLSLRPSESVYITTNKYHGISHRCYRIAPQNLAAHRYTELRFQCGFAPLQVRTYVYH